MKFFLIFVSFLFSVTVSLSQSIKPDSVKDIQLKKAVALYSNYTIDNAAIYNGVGYLYYTFRMEGDPFFITIDLTKGWAGYQGRVYNNLLMGYDIQRNQVTIATLDNFARIVLQNELVDSFNVSGHTFIHLVKDYKQNLANTGFYDLLYTGGIQLLARRIKIREDVIKNYTVVRIFTEKDDFYIHKGDLYYLVSSKKEAFRLFGSKAKDVKKMMRCEHFSMGRKNLEAGLLKAVTFYDQLIH